MTFHLSSIIFCSRCKGPVFMGFGEVRFSFFCVPCLPYKEVRVLK